MAESEGKPPLVFLHGWTMEGRIFADVITRLEDRFSCHTMDLPGHGKADQRYPLTIEGAAERIRDYLLENRIERPVLVAWSLGAMAVWNLLRRFPDLDAAGLAVIDMSPKIVNDDSWHLGMRHFNRAKNERTLMRMREDWQSYCVRINESTFAAGHAPQAQTLDIMRRQNPQAMAAMWRALASADERQTISQLACPMLVMSGAKSRVYSSDTAVWLVQNAPAAEHVIFPQSGHAPLLEEKERFSDVLAEWALRIRP
ncbi:alpha/beta fold hydrolase [Rhizobium sp. L1K21]|uniref:alpha/beta fold hydrolase n=1 Tax=Rhizobium sp. L1K21 TaxID=2954933 RepID=UPI002093AF77|nr:alpha/beta fold hydrolase [Rhizobium sp. L1K21]MCO6188295.1 alpha/beta fold hydrolase [Rhizobium sp. L1K21]